jgi:hypothetical protein
MHSDARPKEIKDLGKSRPVCIRLKSKSRRTSTVASNLEGKVPGVNTCRIRSISWILKSVVANRVWYWMSFAKKAEIGPVPLCFSVKN